MSNRYTRAIKQLKNKTLDEKLQLLSEIPTNNTTGIFVDTPGQYDDRVEPGPISNALDLDQDGDGSEEYTGDDTTGLFETDGTIKTIEPPGDTSYVLGPMISMWYAWANYTQIGYVRESDRKMVNLGRITGEMSAWDGSAESFTSYGQLTLEQAVWYRDQSRSDYRAFYPGPPSNPADEFGRYLGSIIDTTKDVFNIIADFFTPGTNKGFDPGDILALLLHDDSKIFDKLTDFITNMGTAGKVLLGYWLNLLPKVIDNNFLGQDYVDNAFTDLELGYDRNGKPISVVKDNVIGSGQNPTYNPLTNEIELTFNYDFDTNAEAIAKEPEKYDRSNPVTGSAMTMAQILGGDYGIDSSPVIPAGYGTMLAKAMGGAKPKPGKITISPQKLQQLNPQVFNQLVQRGDFPADAANQPSQNREAPRDGVEVDPEKALESLKQSLPKDVKAQMDFQKTMSMDNFNKLSKSDQNKVMDALKKRYVSRRDGSNFIGAPKNMFKAQAKAAKDTKFKDGYMFDKDPNTGKTRKTPIFSTIPGRSSVLVMGNKPSGQLLTESQKRTIRNIKKPVQVKEIPSKVKVSPKLRNKPKTVGADMMKTPNVPNQFKPPAPNIWQKKDYAANVRASQEKKNQVLELVGAAEHHWTYLTEDSRKKKQEKVNEMMSAEYDKQMELLYEKHKVKESKLDKTISAFRKPTDVKPVYPKDPPPQVDPKTGMHPKYGKNYKHNKLDPQSAEAMPATGNPEIDANIEKATNTKEKARKLKILFGKKG